VGGVSINRGTIPSTTLREAVIDLSGLRQRMLYGESFRAKRQIRVGVGNRRRERCPGSRRLEGHVFLPWVSLYRQDLMTMQGRLLTVAGVAESLVGLAFLLAPGVTTALLLGAEPDSVGLMIARVAGVALLSLGITCWGSRRMRQARARMSVAVYPSG